ncbi:unnamed protein product [Microthlaspi erraticum]|uniref:Phorbol-ester/DAG-type domain-containing protein n=1 Tax=Microthlaspi erraticum TaxID=1685480 RepID=A0A6D2KC37_9BRAS|nr:unnamed protein product [Microthlaspi erraticum]
MMIFLFFLSAIIIIIITITIIYFFLFSYPFSKSKGLSKHYIHKHVMMPRKDKRKGDCCGRFEASSDGYYCKICDFFFHKTCVESSQSINHPSHLMHSLTLQDRQDHYSCTLCRRHMENLIYSCEECGFHTDLHCAMYPPPDVIDNSETHGHKLTFYKWALEYYCYAKCGSIGEGASYSCDECGLTFHSGCVDHPLKPNRSSEVKHPLEVNHSHHPLHPLKLLKGVERPNYCDGTCRLCGKEIGDKLFYHCSSCNFTVDMRCVVSPPAPSLLNLKAHDHQLNLIPRLISFTCNACGLKGDRSPYVCIQCGFMVHQDCLDFPRLININRHDHRVSRTSLIGVVDSVCGVCRKKVDWTCGGFSCHKCPGYIVHSKCATRQDVWNGKELEGIPEETEDTEPYVRIDDNTIQHFSHKEHNLRFNKGCILREEDRWCSACTQPIYPKSFYGCMDCDFFLHKKCAELPKRKRHALHNDWLSLVTSEDDLFYCSACYVRSNGFKYQGEGAFSYVKLDVRCCSIYEPFDHPSHPQHPLYLLSPHDDGICNGCKRFQFKVLRCIEDKCGFVLDVKCATLPQVVNHRVEDHALTLCYGEEAEGKYWCDICEKELNPKKWFYTNKDHETSLHTECVFGDLTAFMPGKRGEYWYNHFEVVLNNSMSRPYCNQCKSRCMFPIMLRLFNGTLDSYICSYDCLDRFPVGDRGWTRMEIFRKAETVRLRSYHDKYLLAEDDEESVNQDRDGRSMNARWTVEIVEEANVIRLKSCFGKYLTASNIPMFLGMTGKKVTQTLPRRLDSSTEWEPVREGVQVRLKTRYGQYLRANGGLPPWRNSITHDIPHRTTTQDWVLWDIDILESRKKKTPPVDAPPPAAASPPPMAASPPAFTPLPPPPPPPELLMERKDDYDEPHSPEGFSLKSPRFSKTETVDRVSSPVRADGRLIYYRVADNDQNVDESAKEELFCFKGMGLEELKQKLEEETGLSGISICSKNPLNGKLYPLRLHLPPNNTKMHVVLIPSSSKGDDAASTS